jgi:poly-gamma-glutamate capsule biosynthesis protein CapA/YwtB (metallophosphatase superfamily)
MGRHVCLFVCGDVMTGRGVDQILAHPGNPRLYEPHVHDARDYVRLAEAAHGPIPYPVACDYLWGDALQELDAADVRIINLETSITARGTHWPGKAIHYRMNPQNIPCLTAGGIDCCALANNHVLDWGYQGLAGTLATLDKAGIQHAGAGANTEEAASPAVLQMPGNRRLWVFSFGSATSGIPPEWAAGHNRPGVNLLEDLSARTGHRIASKMCTAKGPGDVVVASIHWGGNWGYEIPEAQIHFAHCLIEEGVDLVHGHSSHHFKAVEVYREHSILYGCGDFLTDYEGIGGHETFRSDLALMYFLRLDPSRGSLVDFRLVPMQVRRFQLRRAAPADVQWVRQTLQRESARFGTAVSLNPDNSLSVPVRSVPVRA